MQTELDIVPIPQGFEQGVGEAEHQQVLDRLLAEEVIDAKDRRLVVVPVQDLVELAGAREVAPERLLDHDPTAVVHPLTGQAGGHLIEQERRNGQIGHGATAVGNALTETTKGLGPVVVALDVEEPLEQPIGDGLVGVDVGRVQRARHPFAKGSVVPLGPGDPDHRHIETAVDLELVERGEQLLVRKVARHAEQDQRIAGGQLLHEVDFSWWPAGDCLTESTSPGGRRTRCAWPTAPCWRRRRDRDWRSGRRATR